MQPREGVPMTPIKSWQQIFFLLSDLHNLLSDALIVKLDKHRKLSKDLVLTL